MDPDDIQQGFEINWDGKTDQSLQKLLTLAFPLDIRESSEDSSTSMYTSETVSISIESSEEPLFQSTSFADSSRNMGENGVLEKSSTSEYARSTFTDTGDYGYYSLSEFGFPLLTDNEDAEMCPRVSDSENPNERQIRKVKSLLWDSPNVPEASSTSQHPKSPVVISNEHSEKTALAGIACYNQSIRNSGKSNIFLSKALIGELDENCRNGSQTTVVNGQENCKCDKCGKIRRSAYRLYKLKKKNHRPHTCKKPKRRHSEDYEINVSRGSNMSAGPSTSRTISPSSRSAENISVTSKTPDSATYNPPISTVEYLRVRFGELSMDTRDMDTSDMDTNRKK